MNPFTPEPAASVAALGERRLLLAIRAWLGDVAPPPPWGMGDDCAVLETGLAETLLATTDGVVYGRHFDDDAAPAAVGAKLVKRNLSDIAAMGGMPGPALINLLLARNTSMAWLQEFYAGVAQCCRQHGVNLVGGDVAQGPDGVFAAHLTLLGIPGPSVLKRTGAQIGDTLFVTGELGGSILGRHLTFTPRLAEGQWLARQKGVRGVIDVTDGLAKDLPDILPPGANASLDTAALPVSAEARHLAERDGGSALVHALTDGEDYELLFALNSQSAPDVFENLWRKDWPTPLTRIGKIIAATDATHATGQAPDGDRQLRDALTGALLLAPGAHGYEHLH